MILMKGDGDFKMQKCSIKRQFSIETIFLITVIVAIVILTLVRIGLMAVMHEWTMVDHRWIWEDCYFAFHRINPYTALKQGIVINGIPHRNDIATTPWGFVIAGIIHGSFLPLEIARIWYIAIHICFLIILLKLLNKRFGQELCDRVIISLLFFASWEWMTVFTTWNNGLLIVMSIIIGILLSEDHPYFSAIFMSIAMIKPQIAVPFFVVFLLYGRWRIIITAVSIVLTTWGISSVWMRETPLKLLEGILVGRTQQTEVGNLFFGFMDFLVEFGVPITYVMLMSMIGGLVILVVIIYWLRKKKKIADDNIFIIYSIPAMICTIWCYSSPIDYIIYTIPAVALYKMYKELRVEKRYLSIAVAASWVCLFTKPFMSSMLPFASWFDVKFCTRANLLLHMLPITVLIMLINMINQEKLSRPI